MARQLDEASAAFLQEAERSLVGAPRGRTAASPGSSQSEFATLAMDGTRFETRIQTSRAKEDWRPTGIDVGEFFLSPNVGEDLRPLARIVSGGELSRVMLALKTLTVAADGNAAPARSKSLIFDEVDAGIGGRVATVVGQKLAALGDRFQVLCITHLPQIAAFGPTHFLIEKHVRSGRTTTQVAALAGEGRVAEIARMMGGAASSEQALAGARELLDRSKAKGENRPKAKGESRVNSESETRGRGFRIQGEMKYFIETHGCQMNVHDSERMAGLLEQSGFDAAASDSDADLIVINTCSVRERAQEKLYTRLGEIKQAERETGRAPIVAVAGCVAQQEGDALLRRSSVIDLVIGTQRARLLPMLAREAIAGRPTVVDIATPYEDPSFAFGVTRRSDPVRAYVTIIEGCNDFCAFCVVPVHARPRADARQGGDSRRGASTWWRGGSGKSSCSGKS